MAFLLTGRQESLPESAKPAAFLLLAISAYLR